MESINSFIVHNLESFPVIWSRRSAIEPGYAVQWESEMNALLKRAKPFVIIFEEGQPDESHGDRKTRGLWLKRNKLALSSLCKAVVAIESDTVKRTALKVQSALAARAFGVVMEIVASKEAAQTLACALLEQACGDRDGR
ncbi:hypothetical protein PQQ99_03075 [Paraburkholderia sediminicola]|uniref:hypothetical protein n=1 Tax=Paraburkholderia sediminicola TaxID=458836 RepID=UPI0038BA2E4B